MTAIAYPAPYSTPFAGADGWVVSPRTTRPSAATFRRRRLAALGALLVVAALLLAAAAALLAPGTPAAGAVPVARVTYVVQPGDTLWSIAAELAPGADLRPVVDALADANGGASLLPGQRLVLTVPD